MLLSGDESVAQACHDAGFSLGTGYPGTPSTEILEHFEKLGGRAQWAPNEKVALEVGIGVAHAAARTIVTMKHVGLNVAADALFTIAYASVEGALLVVSADDPGLASSQNEQDNRHYARAAGVPMLEPSDSQECYDFTLLATEISERWHTPVLLRMTTRVCHSKSVVRRRAKSAIHPPATPHFEHNRAERVMIPANARPAHDRLLHRMHEIARWNDEQGPNVAIEGSSKLGVLTSGVSFQHVCEAAPEASVLKLGMSWPEPVDTIRAFAGKCERLVAVEEGDPFLVEVARNLGVEIEQAQTEFRLGELSVGRVRQILGTGTRKEEPKLGRGKPPALCPGCPHRAVFTAMHNLDCIVAGDIGCYSLGVLPPFEAMDTLVCMGAAIGVGLGLRHALPPDQAKRVVSVLGDSTFIHSGITGLVEMVYNPPSTGHVLIIVDNGTTAMTGFQEHPGTGRKLGHEATGKVVIEDLARALHVPNVIVTDPSTNPAAFEKLLADSLAKPELTVIVTRRLCLLAAKSIRAYEKRDALAHTCGEEAEEDEQQ